MANPTNLLEMAQRLSREASVNGITPSSTTGQSGEPQRIGDWIVDAWREIQGSKRWNFLWEQVTLTVLDTTNVLATVLPPSRWDKESTWLVAGVGSDNGDRQLDYIPWQEFAITYRRLGTPGGIVAWTIRPDNAFVVNAPALGNTTISVQRWKNPQILVLDSDIPLIPADLTMYIVYTALKKYAGFDEAGAQRQIAVDEMRTMRGALYERCLEEIVMGGSLLDQYD